MKDKLLYVISLKLDDLAGELSSKNNVRGVLVDSRIEGDTLELYLDPAPRDDTSVTRSFSESCQGGMNAPTVEAISVMRARRKARRKRNRMKTRGWDVVAKMTNSKGLSVNIYGPFVDGLKDAGQSRTEQRATVARILRSNKNNPTKESIDYFLENTLEYLRSVAAGGKGDG